MIPFTKIKAKKYSKSQKYWNSLVVKMLTHETPVKLDLVGDELCRALKPLSCVSCNGNVTSRLRPTTLQS